MQYPIFKSVVNTIKDSLSKRNINVTQFKTWEEAKINAAGLEIVIDLRSSTRNLTHMSINFDWDSFREVTLASRMDGTQNHPLLKAQHLSEVNVMPVIDIELVWHFDVEKCQPESVVGNENFRIDTASRWMDMASKRVNELLLSDDIITRWHIEIDGDENGNYLTAINLLSYFQFPVGDLKSLNEVQNYVSRKLAHLLSRANRVIKVADKSVVVVAA